jgi:hypothetical protein
MRIPPKLALSTLFQARVPWPAQVRCDIWRVHMRRASQGLQEPWIQITQLSVRATLHCLHLHAVLYVRLQLLCPDRRLITPAWRYRLSHRCRALSPITPLQGAVGHHTAAWRCRLSHRCMALSWRACCLRSQRLPAVTKLTARPRRLL